MFQSEALNSAGGVRHGFFTREGGTSRDVFASLNCGFGSGDDIEAVRTNRDLVMQQIELAKDSLVTAYQTHSAKVTDVTKPWSPEKAPQVDAMVSRSYGIALGILTADCAPVLFADSSAGVVGAAHAGWRGAKDGVLPATIEAMEKLGADRKRIAAAIGPCIQQNSYEVDQSFFDSFLEDDPAHKRFFVLSDRKGHYRFDLPGYISAVLSRESVGSIESLGLDTYTQEDLFFSYRRATHRQEQQYGRLLSVIALESL
ncbi:MAG: peptidoglycan editing factor PgeF [Rhodospirillaceae bacterium]|jgi:YfiH family protein